MDSADFARADALFDILVVIERKTGCPSAELTVGEREINTARPKANIALTPKSCHKSWAAEGLRRLRCDSASPFERRKLF